MKSKIGLAVNEINRIVRYVDKEENGVIDYYRFLDFIDSTSKLRGEGLLFTDIREFCEKLSLHLK
jgi:hypothetical protein